MAFESDLPPLQLLPQLQQSLKPLLVQLQQAEKVKQIVCKPYI